MGRLAPPELVPQAGGRPQLKGRRGGPGDFEYRLARAGGVKRSAATAAQLAFLSSVLGHQRDRASSSTVRAAAAQAGAGWIGSRLVEHFPLLNLTTSVETVVDEIPIAVAALRSPVTPGPLGDAGRNLAARSRAEQLELVKAWIDDPSLLEARIAAWIGVAAGPVLELAAAALKPLSKEEWTGPACPACGGLPQVSVIREESGEFMAGSPRYLVCGRCALWWSFARATCPWCGEDDSRRVGSFSPEGERLVRIDACDTCHAYVKTFDLREPGGKDVVPLVDDVATLTLDVWAHEKGLQRSGVSLAGV
ncbi:MAG: formate dehydrogenase accessory protein FdhE [Actinomycetota bacterium]